MKFTEWGTQMSWLESVLESLHPYKTPSIFMSAIQALLRKWRGKTKVFGVVFYDVRHPYVKKVLADRDFWSALDALSGPRWAIFTPELDGKGGSRLVARGDPGELSRTASWSSTLRGCPSCSSPRSASTTAG